MTEKGYRIGVDKDGGYVLYMGNMIFYGPTREALEAFAKRLNGSGFSVCFPGGQYEKEN